MSTNNSKYSRSATSFLLAVLFFLFYLGYWFYVNHFDLYGVEILRDYFADSFGLVALFGAFVGFNTYRIWGGEHSKLGRTLLLLSVALLFQFLGQVSFAYYYYVLGVVNPYPSFGELFYFGSLPIYILALWVLADISGVRFSFKRYKFSKYLTTFISVIMLFFAYHLFLKDYDFSDTTPLVVFLDFGYPLLQSVMFILAGLILIASRGFLGGTLRKPIIFIMISILIQYGADTFYTIQTINETWYAASFSDLLYLISYFSMSVALYQFYLVYVNFYKNK